MNSAFALPMGKCPAPLFGSSINTLLGLLDRCVIDKRASRPTRGIDNVGHTLFALGFGHNQD
ncbi:hypothetical protein B7H18_26180 [Pseudomonas putida]|nr:hypothetical protein B7H18_26180 [Pseudomonas putida]